MVTSVSDRRPLVYATILYWQMQELSFLRHAVESLLAQSTDHFELRITVIDNGLGSVPDLPSEPRVELLQLKRNSGFSGGHNQGIRRAMCAGADYVFLLNSDAIAAHDCLHLLVTAAEEQTTSACVGPVVVRSSTPELVESAGQQFHRTWARHKELDRDRHFRDIRHEIRHVDAVSGCAMLIRTSALLRVGMFDEQLFAYFEDMDWCLRACRAGYQVLVEPRARVYHAGGGSTKPGSALPTYYSVRNHIVVAKRYCGLAAAGLVPGYHGAYLARSRSPRMSEHLAALARGALHGWTGRLGPWVPRAIRN